MPEARRVLPRGCQCLTDGTIDVSPLASKGHKFFSAIMLRSSPRLRLKKPRLSPPGLWPRPSPALSRCPHSCRLPWSKSLSKSLGPRWRWLQGGELTADRHLKTRAQSFRRLQSPDRGAGTPGLCSLQNLAGSLAQSKCDTSGLQSFPLLQFSLAPLALPQASVQGGQHHLQGQERAVGTCLPTRDEVARAATL